MEAKFSSDILAVLFFILFLVQQGSAVGVDSLFGGDTSDKDAVLYTGIIVGIVSVFAVIFVIIALCLTYRAAKIINRHRTSRDNDHRDSYDERDAMMMREKRRTDESSEEDQRKSRKKKDDSDEEYDNRRRNTREQPKRKSFSDDERYEKPRESAKNRSDEAPEEVVDLVISSL